MTKVAMETVDPVRRRLAVEIPAGEVTAEIDRAYDRLRRRANVPGFRQGRAPRAVLERLFGDQVRADVFGRLVQETYVEALREQQIEPVGQPEIVTEQAQPGEPLRYSATVEVRPEVVASDYTGVEVERPVRAVTDDDVERFLEQLRQSRARLVPIEGRDVAQAGDVATISYEARVDGRVVGRGDDRLIELGGEADDGPGAHLIGVRVGVPTAFTVDYRADHGNAELAGKRVDFQATIASLQARDVPPLDDAFAAEHTDCEDLATLRERARAQLEASLRRESETAVRAALVGRLVAAHDVSVPHAMIARRLEILVDQVIEDLGPRRPPASREPALRARLHEELRDQARDQVKAALVLEAIAAQEGLRVDDAEVEARIDQLAESAGKARERVRALYNDAAARSALRSRVVQERAIEWVVERAVIRDVDTGSGVAGSVGNG